MIIFRRLQIKDADGMLRWMHDKEASYDYKTDFQNYTKAEVIDFINHSFSEDNKHFAVVNEQDEYIGTISLKNISKYNKNAELTSGFGKWVDSMTFQCAIEKMIDYAFDDLGLDEVYIHVFEDNIAMIRFYENLGFSKGGTFVSQIQIRDVLRKLCWYYKRKTVSNVENHQLLYFQEKGDMRGHMVIIEQLKDVPFDIKRLFYIYGSDETVRRGMHANRNSEFVLINVAGKSKVKVFDGHFEHIYELNQPHTGVYLPKMVWKEMYDFSEDSVLLVLSSEIYDANEYIRDFDDYMKEINKI